ncbi:cobalamin biosynthesis protein [Luteipulveratus sp. YIM 133132]|uniref:cobalamin biosynthesis protein n=1 Tax=Luteipulveratus flavus TaxID=3031728 RepID=UPI0023AEE6A1|nr:cobalamin biosynthesis protein [Luteipulveratus sp. YIM 133132]MDE9365240.1 cobalamin biosynthesis protein [Luteipulveratus sp. YIM 133132]
MSARAAGLLLGFALDRLLGDPSRGHPVALFGSLARQLEARTYAQRRLRGATFAGVLAGGPVVVGVLLERSVRRRPVAAALATAAATYVVLGGRTLEREAHAVAALLEADDLPGARRRVTHLVGRTPDRLSAQEVARAAVESVAENTSDAVVAPLLWGAVAGVPGLLGYRAINTLDAMVGHRNERYVEFGWGSARLDDMANLAPARATALLAGVTSGRPAEAVRVWRRDARQHPSPNAGPVEAAFAGGLGVRMGGRNSYDGAVEDRGELGDGPGADVPDIRRATHLARRVDVAAAALTVALAVRLGRLR